MIRLFLRKLFSQGYDYYLSGPMTGLPDYNRASFDKTAKVLRDKGFIVFSPAELGTREKTMPRAWYMKKDIQALLNSNAIIMLPNWETSEGAKLEFEIAKEIGLPVTIYMQP